MLAWNSKNILMEKKKNIRIISIEIKIEMETKYGKLRNKIVWIYTKR